MDKEIYFISDNHFMPFLNEEERERRQLFFELLKQIKNGADRLYIVGDFFDFWFEYKYVIPRHYFDILCELKAVVKSGCQVHFMGGNHDFWLYDFFTENGMQVYYDDVDMEIGDKKFFITHGDGKLNLDPFYPAFRKVIRNPLMIKLFRLLHPDLAYRIARLVSRTSRNKSPDSSDTLENLYMRKIEEFSHKKFQQGYDFVVTGHYHFPMKYEKEGGIFINLGDWLEHFTYGRYHKGQFYLETFQQD